ncbi:MAG: hypothetical protein EPO26_01575 [Chloroflexota bacterium]|nr:MAG: hypothetical protein EPO26_01575 [Chloroflexota bacterium]
MPVTPFRLPRRCAFSADAPRLVRDRIRLWTYRAVSRRDLRLDLLRGYCVFAMLVDHLDINTPYYWFTGGNRFFTSAAEGFLFLSAVVMGVVYRPIAERDGAAAVLRKAGRRVAQLAAITVVVTLGYMWLSARLGLPWAANFDPRVEIPRVLSFSSSYYLVDVLNLYVVLVALAPSVFLGFARHRPWFVFGVSGAIWTIHQFWPISLPWPAEGGFYYIAAWQFLFVIGLAVGWYRDTVTRRLSFLSAPRGQAMLVLAAIAFIWFWHSTWLLDGYVPDVGAAITAAFAKWNLPPARLFASAVFFSLAFSIIHYFWRPLSAAIGWLLIPFGQNALFAYVVHLALIVVLLAARAEWLTDANTLAVGIGLQTIGLASLWLVTSGRSALGRLLSAGPVWFPASSWLDRAARLGVAGVLALVVASQPFDVPTLPGFVALPADQASFARPRVLVHAPPDAAARQPLPIVIVLADEEGEPDALARDFIEAADKYGWFLIAPRIEYQDDSLDPAVIAAESPGLIRGLREIVEDVAHDANLRLRRRVTIFGFGRGASLAQRYALTYAPETRAVALLGGGGYTLPPMNDIAEDPQFPFGVRDMSAAVGRSINVDALRRIRFWIGVGERDTDTATTSRAWDKFLGATRVERAATLARVLMRDGNDTRYVIVPDAGHEMTADARSRIVQFIVDSMSSGPFLPPVEPRRQSVRGPDDALLPFR